MSGTKRFGSGSILAAVFALVIILSLVSGRIGWDRSGHDVLVTSLAGFGVMGVLSAGALFYAVVRNLLMGFQRN